MSDAQSLLDDIAARVLKLPETARDELIDQALEATRHLPWVPNPGPQTQAVLSEADELFYGGQAGGGKSDLGVGLALTQHRLSLILRRFNDDAKDLAERALEILGTRDGYNGADHIIRRGSQHIRFSGCKELGDRQRFKGKPRDLIVFDEIPDFLEAQYRFIIGWCRSADRGQRTRVVNTGNPPTTAEGLWVIKYWGAWLDPTHPKYGKVAEGELLWYTTIKGEDVEVDGPGPHVIEGEIKPVMAKSRTFIRARLEDNPDLAESGYDSRLAAMPEELREAYREGKFDAGLRDKPFQLIPTTWVRAAFERWTEQPPPGVPMCAMGVDCTGGSIDPMVIAPRHDGWYPAPIIIPGKDIPAEKAGRAAAGYVVAERRDGCVIVVDMGGGYGGPCYEQLHENIDQESMIEPKVRQYKGSESSIRRTQDQAVGFNNKRTEALWKFREALDPGQIGGSPIFLHPDNELLADLTTPTYELRRAQYYALPKEDVCKLLGRSTNKGDAVVMAWTAGPIASTHGAAWTEYRKEMAKRMLPGGFRPQVVMGRANARTRR